MDELAERYGLSTSGLARLAGLDATAFNKSKRQSKDGRLRWPTTESLSRVLAAVGVDFADFATLVSGDTGRRLPVLNRTVAGIDRVFATDGTVRRGKDLVTVSDDLELGFEAFLFEITGSDYEPKYRAGDQLIVAPGAALAAGDEALVLTRSDRLCLTSASAALSGGDLTFTSLSDEIEAYSAGELKWASKIAWVRP